MRIGLHLGLGLTGSGAAKGSPPPGRTYVALNGTIVGVGAEPVIAGA